MGGDFRQCLPIVSHGSVADILAITVKRSKLWPAAKKLKLHRNMRANESENAFKLLLSDLGEGKLPSIELSSHESLIEIPDEMIISNQGYKD